MTNRLAQELSPYLRQHSENPVDWYPWGPEALERARSEDKPIFLSIGYAACHWCHVMAHESFEDPETAALLNARFISIKVDREERPDLDALYMDAVVSLTGSGGWPMSVFLTPEGEPFFGGTYFPPEPRHGLPAFRQVLTQVAAAWGEHRGDVVEAGRQLASQIRQNAPSASTAQDSVTRSTDAAAEGLLRTYDWDHGGWGTAPKFPQPLAIEFLLRRARRGDRLALDMASHALDHMAAGGIHDQVGGGFHRYAVDGRWLIPHFEKMLYDNALLSRAYLHAYQVSGKLRYLEVAEGTLGFLLREMRDPAGGFFASLDADSEGEEGRFYTWTLEEARQALGESLPLDAVLAELGVTSAGNFEGRNVLWRASGISAEAATPSATAGPQEEVLHAALERLLRARARRIRPACDDKVIAEWNGLLLVTLCEAARATGSQAYHVAAHDLAEFLCEEMVSGSSVTRIWRGGRRGQPGLLADYASVALGLLAMYQTDFDLRWLDTAQGLADSIRSRFGDMASGLYDTSDDHETLFSRPHTLQDSPTPCGSSLAAMLFLQLASLTGRSQDREAAEALLGPLARTAAQYPTAHSFWLCSLDAAARPMRQLALVGPIQDPQFQAMAKVASARYEPQLVVAGGLGNRPGLLRGRSQIGERPTAYLCTDFACRTPTTDPAELSRQLSGPDAGEG